MEKKGTNSNSGVTRIYFIGGRNFKFISPIPLSRRTNNSFEAYAGHASDYKVFSIGRNMLETSGEGKRVDFWSTIL